MQNSHWTVWQEFGTNLRLQRDIKLTFTGLIGLNREYFAVCTLERRCAAEQVAGPTIYCSISQMHHFPPLVCSAILILSLPSFNLKAEKALLSTFRLAFASSKELVLTGCQYFLAAGSPRSAVCKKNEVESGLWNYSRSVCGGVHYCEISRVLPACQPQQLLPDKQKLRTPQAVLLLHHMRELWKAMRMKTERSITSA